MIITANANLRLDSTKKLYIRIIGGGCSGFMYKVEEITNTEKLIKVSENFELYTDEDSQKIIQDTTLDYITSPLGGTFKFSYNKASRCCGCGKSFC